jgi:glycosyltransferase involved in cell wall biosynthesis
MKRQEKILQIGNYPPPMCGWAMQTKLVTDELRRRGHLCAVLKINENRKMKDPAYQDVQGGFDYAFKVMGHALAGYRLNVHLNGQSAKGYILALIATLTGRTAFRPTLITFHGGLGQAYFPRQDSLRLRWAFRFLFLLAGGIACDNDSVRQAIVSYGINPGKIAAIETFSSQYVQFQPLALPQEVDAFLKVHSPVFFCYVSFRPEYRLDVLRAAMARVRQQQPRAGFIWLGFPARELLNARQFADSWSISERQSLLLLGNLTHDEFLTLMSRCHASVRTPICDGVAASVLESLALGVPVVASENGQRPQGVITYDELDAVGLAAKLEFVAEHHAAIKASLRQPEPADNVKRMADWLSGERLTPTPAEVVHAV